MTLSKEVQKLSINVPRSMKRELETKFPRHGASSKLIRTLLKLYFLGKIDKKLVDDSADFL